MAKTKREFIIATFIISCAATVLSIVSMATEEWVTGNLKANKEGLQKAEVNYGLFGGSLVQYSILSGQKEQQKKIAIACIFEENICGFSISTSGNQRKKDLENIFNDNYCDKKTASESKELLIDDYVNVELFEPNDVDKMRYRIMKQDIDTTTVANNETTTDIDDTEPRCDKTFLNSGLWLSSTFFLSLSIMMGAITSTISVMNTAGNPVSPWFNIWGLYIWNSLASSFILMTLILYGAHFASIITSNVSIVDTLNGNYVNGTVNLGFSYWLLLGPFLLHLVNNGLFVYRQYLIEKEPQITEDKIDAADRDGMIFVY